MGVKLSQPKEGDPVRVWYSKSLPGPNGVVDVL